MLESFDAIEECYEFMLAYAAQGTPLEAAAERDGELREYLQRAAVALAGLTDGCRAIVAEARLDPAERYERFFQVLARDADNSLAAIELVLAQRGLSSQIIDNLNASIHLKALLTDIFLLDEIVDAARIGNSGVQPH
jgi:hypothetical protein